MPHLGLQSHPIILQSVPRPKDVIRLGGKRFATISESLQRRKSLPKFVRAISSPLLTASLAATLTALVTRSPRKTLGVFTAVGVPLGLATTFPQFIPTLKRTVFRPVKAGEFIGRKLAGADKDKRPLGERVKAGFKTAGLIGGLTVAGLGAVTLAKRVFGTGKRAKLPKIPSIGLPPSPTSIIQKIPTTAPTPIEPFVAAKKVVEEEKPMAVTPTIPTSINTKINVKPVINIKFSKSKKFINQQILVRSGSFHR